jgi:hypothetical protein
MTGPSRIGVAAVPMMGKMKTVTGVIRTGQENNPGCFEQFCIGEVWAIY